MIRVQTHRAYIDILEIRHARGLNITAIVFSTIIAYLAVWSIQYVNL